MIQLLFDYLNEKVIILIDGKNIRFGKTDYGAQTTTIDGLQLNYSGCIKEHPDLKGDSDWRKKSIKRFKYAINKLNNEEEISNYIINDLRKHNYIPKLKQKQGFRPVKI